MLFSLVMIIVIEVVSSQVKCFIAWTPIISFVHFTGQTFAADRLKWGLWLLLPLMLLYIVFSV